MSSRARRGKVLGHRGAPAQRSSGLQSSRARFATRAAQVRRRPWLLVAGLVVVLLFLAGGVWVVESSPVLAARSVSVKGVSPTEVSKIVARAAVPLGTPMARLDMRAIARRVIDTPTLAEVTVSRSWPSTVVISASVRVPVLAVKNPQGQVQVVDAQGTAYATVSQAPQGVPLIDTVENPPSSQSMRAAIAVLRVLSPQQRRTVSKVTVSGPNDVELKLGGVTVVWGGASEPELKVEVMTALLKEAGVQTIDVSAPRTPAVR